MKLHQCVLLVCLFGANAMAGDYSNNPKAQEFITMMVNKHGFNKSEITQVLAQAEKKQNILDAIARPAEKTKPWFEYREIFLGKDRIDQGVAFWQENEAVLNEVSREYGVEPEIIIAIIGVETRYGRHMGSYRVLDALATLGFDYPPRAKFFAGQLEQFFILTREQQQDPTKLMGSYAGAMGYGQFIPSSYRSFAKDHDKDGVADIWQNKSDAIASVANYFNAHGWQKGGEVFAKASLSKPVPESKVNPGKKPSQTLQQWQAEGVQTQGKNDSSLKAVLLAYDQPNDKEYLMGFNNFYVITRYNRSHMYARAVWELSQAIVQQKMKAPGV